MGAEKNFENKVKKFLSEQDCYFLKIWGGGYQKAGIPDILCCCEGFFLGIELKAPKGKPSDLQLVNLKRIDEAGGFGILLYPDDFERFKSMVFALKNNFISIAMVHYEILKERWCPDE